jgi:hypothetical protein
MSKMSSHEPFGHLQPKLWAKEGPGVKLAVWLLTTKSRESTCSRCALGECDMALESSWQELQHWFRPCPDRRSGRESMTVQSPGSPNWDSFRTPFWESRDKKPFGCHLRGVYYMGEGGGFPRVQAVMSQVSPSARCLSQHPRVFPNVN